MAEQPWTVRNDTSGIVVTQVGAINPSGMLKMLDTMTAYLMETSKIAVMNTPADKIETKDDSNGKMLIFHIMSGGGDLQSVYMLYDHIKLWKKSGVVSIVKTYGHGLVASAAAFWLAMGDKGHRYISKSTTLLLHGAVLTMDGDIVNSINFGAQMRKKQNDFAAEVLGKEYENLGATDVVLNYEKAIKAGIADHVI